MFTGIITHQGTFRGLRHGRREFVIEEKALAGRVKPGESIAVDGVCLTVTSAERAEIVFDLSQETLDHSTIGGLRPGDQLNLELPLTLASRLGGHMVTGHVDAVGKVTRITARPPGKRLTITFPAGGRSLLVAKGSVTLNGVSLTVAALGPSSFDVELIPVTLETTNLGRLQAGAAVNVEYDIIGKYVYNYMLGRSRKDHS
jgi:riboflavin synthase